jgi:hypothetical protein
VSQINFEDETLDASDGVTRLLLAAEYWKEKATTLRAELEKAKSVPMKYRRMEFNAQLQNENTRLRAELDALKEQEPAGEVVLFGERLKEISWRKGKLPDVGTKLYARPVPAPSVPEGWKLVPTAESRHPGIYKMLGALHAIDNTRGASEWESYAAMLAAAPEAKT